MKNQIVEILNGVLGDPRVAPWSDICRWEINDRLAVFRMDSSGCILGLAFIPNTCESWHYADSFKKLFTSNFPALRGVSTVWTPESSNTLEDWLAEILYMAAPV